MSCHTETERGDHDYRINRSNYTDTDHTSRKWAMGSNPPSPDQESGALSTELPHPVILDESTKLPITYDLTKKDLILAISLYIIYILSMSYIVRETFCDLS